MPFTVAVALAYEFDVKAPYQEVFGVLSDVPTSAGFYPKLARLTALGRGAYRWEMEPVGTAQVHLQTVYASKYVSSKTRGTVVWTPVAGEGNARVSGDWKITDRKKSTNVVLNVEAEITLELPALMRIVAEPLIHAEFEQLTERYIDNLIERFGGEV